MKSGFLILTFLLLSSLAVHAQEDILEYAARHPLGIQTRQPDGSFKAAMYGDPKLAEAETFLSARYPRPWVVAQVLVWLRDTKDLTTQVHLLRVLAASRDAKAALALGGFLHSDSFDLRFASYDALLHYFPVARTSGSTGARFAAVDEWFASNRDRLESEAAR